MNSGMNLVCVGLGGATGACLRYGVSLALPNAVYRFPLATLSVNIVGALVAGIVATWFLQRGQQGTPLQLLLVVGLLGGFTTFSAFSVDTLQLLNNGELSRAMLNVLLNVAGSLIAVLLGSFLLRLMVR